MGGKVTVLILVVMDDALVRVVTGVILEKKFVLILVVMDDALVRRDGWQFFENLGRS